MKVFSEISEYVATCKRWWVAALLVYSAILVGAALMDESGLLGSFIYPMF
jgi:hypothetical protein